MKQFLCLVSGTSIVCDCIKLEFSTNEFAPAISVSTCSKCIVLSKNIKNAEDLNMELSILLKEKSFTMA